MVCLWLSVEPVDATAISVLDLAVHHARLA